MSTRAFQGQGTVAAGNQSGVLAERAILLFLVLLRLPFILLHHVQEDAYITLRTSRHLAENGDFSFNLHQHFPATTSLVYPLIVAALDLVFRGGMVLAVQCFGTLCVVAACWLAAASLTGSSRERAALCLFLGCWPVSLVASYTAMETPLVLLALAAALYGFSRERDRGLFLASMLALPLIRPDAVSYGLILCAAMWLVDRRAALRGAGALVAGVCLLLAGNRVTSGHFVPTTSRAKEIAYHPDHALVAVFGRIRDVFWHQSFLLPVSTSYLVRLAPVFLAITVTAFIFAYRRQTDKRQRVMIGAMAAIAVAVPAAYAAGGVLFDWYLFPANWIAALVMIAEGVRLAGRLPAAGVQRRGAWACVALVWCALMALQWTRSLVASTQDFHYRGDIGRYLAELSHGQGTLFLEPAGYIPYYSGLRTDDEVGLVSDNVTGYMLNDSQRWWIDYVEAERPLYIVQREAFAHYETFQGYTLTPAEQVWFNAHYVLLRRTHYEPRAYHPSPYLKRFLAMGPMPDYLVFVRRSPGIPN